LIFSWPLHKPSGFCLFCTKSWRRTRRRRNIADHLRNSILKMWCIWFSVSLLGQLDVWLEACVEIWFVGVQCVYFYLSMSVLLEHHYAVFAVAWYCITSNYLVLLLNKEIVYWNPDAFPMHFLCTFYALFLHFWSIFMIFFIHCLCILCAFLCTFYALFKSA
jgi:hypothetical protein